MLFFFIPPLSHTEGVTEMEDHPKRLFQGSMNMLTPEISHHTDSVGW